jgi:glutamate-1-semialdehyde 2,1-aminomutase
LAMNAGLTTLRLLQQPGVYDELNRKTARLAQGLELIAQEAGFPVWVNALGAMFSIFFTEGPVKDYASACRSDVERFAKYFKGMLEHGIYLAPSQYEAVFLSTAHTDEDLDTTLDRARQVIKTL